MTNTVSRSQPRGEGGDGARTPLDERGGRQKDRYLLGASAQELAHLVAQAEVYADEARQLLDHLDIGPGASAVDVGCGVLGILHLLCERVGATGRVVGIDREPRMIEAARAVTVERGLAVEFAEQDATGLSLPSDSFDLVHERTLLLNVANPEKVVAEMVRVTRRGGVVALQEPDSACWLCDPPHQAFGTLHQELLAAYRVGGKEFDQGRTIARRLTNAGLTEVQVRVTARVTEPGQYYHTFLLALTGLVRDQILAAGRISAAEFDRLSADLREHLAQSGSRTCQPNLWQAWGKKP